MQQTTEKCRPASARTNTRRPPQTSSGSKPWFVGGRMDLPFLLLTLLLTVMGLVMLFSASFPSANYETGDPTFYLKRQGLFALLGLAAMVVMSRMNYQKLRRYSVLLVGISLFLLLLVLVPGLGISYKTAVIIVAVVVTIYSIMGGLWSVTLTDFVQVFLIIIGMIIAVPFAMNLAGGWSNVVANVPAETFDMFKGYSPMAVVSLTIMYVATFTVGQEAVSRYYAARDGKAAKQGSILAAIINFIYAFIPAILGIITLALINMGKFNAEDFADVGARYALPVLAMEAMPAVICGLLFAGIISATMSSSDSDLLGAGSIFANDIYRAVLKPDATSEEVMKVTKIVMAIVGVASMFIALFNTSSIVSLLMFCFTLRAAGAFFPYVLGHYWTGASLAGTIASLISGSIVVVYLEKISGSVLFGVKLSQPIIPGLVVGLVFFLVFSKLFPPKVKTTELAPEED